MNKELPERKRNRLRSFDYSSVGMYFLTICTAERRNYFWSNLNVGACIARPQNAEMPSMFAPTMSRVVQQMKGYVTKRIGVAIWQKLFFDHVIRNRRDYEEHVKYIYNNPRHWYLDELYSKGPE